MRTWVVTGRAFSPPPAIYQTCTRPPRVVARHVGREIGRALDTAALPDFFEGVLGFVGQHAYAGPFWEGSRKQGGDALRHTWHPSHAPYEPICVCVLQARVFVGGCMRARAGVKSGGWREGKLKTTDPTRFSQITGRLMGCMSPWLLMLGRKIRLIDRGCT